MGEGFSYSFDWPMKVFLMFIECKENKIVYLLFFELAGDFAGE
jgi:hypothetical protein